MAFGIFLKNSDFVFTAGAANAGTIVFAANARPEKISDILSLSIINATTGVETEIFNNIVGSGKGGAYNDATGTLTLAFNTTGLTGGVQAIVAYNPYGLQTDSPSTDSTSSWSIISILKGIWARINALDPDVDNAPQTANPRPVTIGGKAVTSASYAPAYADNDAVQAAFDKTSGALLTNQGALAETTDSVGAIPRPTASVSFGIVPAQVINLSNSALPIKAGAGNVYGLVLTNPHATDDAFVKLFNLAAASVVVGGGTATVPNITFTVKAGQTVVINFPIPLSFGTAISWCATKFIATNDGTAPSSSLVAAHLTV